MLKIYGHKASFVVPYCYYFAAMKLREWLLMGFLEMGLKPYFCSDNKSITENNSEHLVDSNAGENNCQFLNNL